MYFKILETIQAPPYIAYQNGRGKEEQHDKAKAMRENVVSGILFYLYRSVPDFGKMCQEASVLPHPDGLRHACFRDEGNACRVGWNLTAATATTETSIVLKTE